MTTIALDVARDPSIVNAALADLVSAGIAEVLDKAHAGAGARALEEEVCELAASFGRSLLSGCMAAACKRATDDDIERRQLEPGEVLMRLDRDYWATQMTTLGPIRFPLFAYRQRRAGGSVTRTPARAEVVPLLGRCRSSELCLQWEARLGKDLPFRPAQQAMSFFSHGAVEQEDTTLAAHMVAVGGAVERSWLYRPADELREILAERATRDAETGRPVMYLSQDAHAERRYVDETWTAAWKSLNGLRLWAVDRKTGATIHLGGEYTWGDCHEVERLVKALVDDGILPVDGDYGHGLVAELVVVTDGLPWIEQYVLDTVPWAHAVLDLYHALQRLSRFATKCFGAGSKAAGAFYRRLARRLTAQRPSKRGRPVPRKGGRRKAPSRRDKAYGSIYELLGALYEDEAEAIPDKFAEEFELMLSYFENNAYRGDYDRYHARGFQLGSGAMESLHRTAAQQRLKLAGARWLPETAQAVVNLRLLDLVGRWDEFWGHEGLTDVLRNAFGVSHAPARAGNAT